MKKKFILLLIILSVFLTFNSMGNEKALIKELCRKKNLMYEKLKNYEKIVNTEIFTYDQSGKLLTKEKKHIEMIWDRKGWVEKGNPQKKETDKNLYPFDDGCQQFFDYTVKDNGEDYIITVKLKDKFKKAHAETGEYIISKKTGYFKEENTILNRMPSPFIKTFKMKTVYGEIEKGIIAPVEMKNIVISKVIFGVGRKVVIMTRYSYKRIKNKQKK